MNMYNLKPNKKPTPEHPEQVFHNHPAISRNKTPQKRGFIQ